MQPVLLSVLNTREREEYATCRHSGRWPDGQIDRKLCINQSGRQAGRQAGRQVGKQLGRQAGSSRDAVAWKLDKVSHHAVAGGELVHAEGALVEC